MALYQEHWWEVLQEKKSLLHSCSKIAVQKLMNEKREWRAPPGFEPGTSRTLSENHTPRPKSQLNQGLRVNLFVPGQKLGCTGLGVA